MNAEAMNEHPSTQHEFNRNAYRFNTTGESSKMHKRPYQASLMLQSCVITGFYN